MRITAEQLEADIRAIDREIAWMNANRESYVNEFDPSITVDQVLANLEQAKAGKDRRLRKHYWDRIDTALDAALDACDGKNAMRHPR